MKNKFLTKMYKIYTLVNGIPMLTDTSENVSYHSIGEAEHYLNLQCENLEDANMHIGQFVILAVYDFRTSYSERTQQDYLESKNRAEQKYPPLP